MRVLEYKIDNVMSVNKIQEALKSCTCREYNKGIYVIEHNDYASILLEKIGIKKRKIGYKLIYKGFKSIL